MTAAPETEPRVEGGGASPPAPSPLPRMAGYVAYMLRWERGRWIRAAVVLAVGLVLGILVGRVSATSRDVPTGAAAAGQLLPIVRRADALWTADSDVVPAVARGIAQMRTSGEATIVTGHAATWLAGYDQLLTELAAAELPRRAVAVQRELLTAIVLSRDAVEVLVRAAAEAPDSPARPLLVAEAIRLRARSEAAQQSAREALNNLDVAIPPAAVEPPPPPPPFEELTAVP